MKLPTDLVQKYIQDRLDKEQATDFEQQFESAEENYVLAKILQSCKEHYPSFKENEHHTLSFEQIDDMIMQSITDNLSAENLNRLIAAINHEPDVIEKLQTRLQSNETAQLASEQVSLEEVEMLSDEALLQKMNIKTEAQPQKTAGVQQDTFLQKLIDNVSDFVRSLGIPKPAYYLVPIALTALFVSFESTLFFAEHNVIDDYGMDKWSAYVVDEPTLRSMDDPPLDAQLLALENSYKMALTNYISADYKASIAIFDEVLDYVQPRTDIADDLLFDIYFMAGMSQLSFAMTDETTFNDEESRKEYFDTAIKHFTEAKKYIAAIDQQDKNALYYHFAMTLIFLERKEQGKEELQEIKEGDFFKKVQLILQPN